MKRLGPLWAQTLPSGLGGAFLHNHAKLMSAVQIQRSYHPLVSMGRECLTHINDARFHSPHAQQRLMLCITVMPVATRMEPVLRQGWCPQWYGLGVSSIHVPQEVASARDRRCAQSVSTHSIALRRRFEAIFRLDHYGECHLAAQIFELRVQRTQPHEEATEEEVEVILGRCAYDPVVRQSLPPLSSLLQYWRLWRCCQATTTWRWLVATKHMRSFSHTQYWYPADDVCLLYF